MDNDLRPQATSKGCTATSAEVRSAIDALSTADLLRLERFAMWRVRGLGRRAAGRTHEDLLGEAIHAALDGRRNWSPERIDFVRFLVGAMQSISDNWGKRFKEGSTLLEAELTSSPLEDAADVLANIPALGPSPEEEMAAQQREVEVTRLFENDPLVSLIVCGLKDGKSLRELRDEYGLDENEYRAALRRIRRRVSAFYAGGTYV